MIVMLSYLDRVKYPNGVSDVEKNDNFILFEEVKKRFLWRKN